MFSKRPANSMEKSMTIQLKRLAIDKFLNTTPIARQRAAAVRLKRTSTNRNLRNSGTPSTRPTI